MTPKGDGDEKELEGETEESFEEIEPTIDFVLPSDATFYDDNKEESMNKLKDHFSSIKNF